MAKTPNTRKTDPKRSRKAADLTRKGERAAKYAIQGRTPRK